MGTVLMVAAFVVIGGFVYWLRGQAQAERAMEVREDSIAAAMEAEERDDSGAVPISANDITMDASGFEGQRVRLEPQTVASLVGQQGLMLDLPAGPFLVSFSDELIADSVEVQPGDVVRVTGTVTAMTPEIAAGWQEAGRLTEAERMVAEFAVDFIAADDVQVSTPAAEADSTSGGGA
jgi:hypothetical protein